MVLSRIAGSLSSAALFLALISARPAVVVSGQAEAQADKGEQIQNASCISCHDLRPIQTQALDKEGWTKVIDSMIQKGAELKAEDEPVLVAYLVKNHGPLPDGPGKTILLNTCTVCHDLGRVRRQGGTRDDWNDILGAMLNEGAMLSEQDYPVLLAYLTRNFKPQ
jgi:cytochrome c5